MTNGTNTIVYHFEDLTNIADGSNIPSLNNTVDDEFIDYSGSSATLFRIAAFNNTYVTLPSKVEGNRLTNIRYKLPGGGALDTDRGASRGSPGGVNLPVANYAQLIDVTATLPVSSDVQTIDFPSDANYTLGATYSSIIEEGAPIIIMTDTSVFLTVGRNVILPTYQYIKTVKNNTAQPLTFKTSAGTGVAVAAGVIATLICNGVNIIGAANSIVGITGTIAQFNTALTDGDFATGGGTATGTNTGDQSTVSLQSSSISLTGQVADIADTAFTVNTPGLYRISFYLLDTVADVTAGAVSLNIKFTDNSGARTISSSPTLLTAVTSLNQGVIVARLNSGNITYGVTHTGIFGTASYALYVTQEKLQ
jgi:hypothetical protein